MVSGFFKNVTEDNLFKQFLYCFSIQKKMVGNAQLSKVEESKTIHEMKSIAAGEECQLCLLAKFLYALAENFQHPIDIP